VSISEDEFASRPAPEEVPARDEVERLMLLVEASGKLLGSPRLDAVLPAVLELAQRILAADAYALWRHEPETDSWGLELSAGLSAAYREAVGAAVREAPARGIDLNEELVVEDVASIDWPTPAHRAAYDAEGIRALLVVPLRIRGEIGGTLVFYYHEPRRFDHTERRTAVALGNLAASAIGTAELLERQSRTAEERRFLAEASEALSSSRDYGRTLRNVVELAVPRFADWCAADLLLPDGSIDRVAVTGEDSESEPFGPDAVEGIIRGGTAGILSETGSSMIVPLVARGRTIGSLAFVQAGSGRRYTQANLELAGSIARTAALTVDNAQLLREAQRSAAELDALLTTAPVGIGFWDRDLRFVRINDALAAINGPPVGEHLGRELEEVLPELGEQLGPMFREVVQAGRTFVDIEVSGETPAAPGETRHWLASYYPVTTPEGERLGVGAVVADITARKRAEAERARLQDQLEFLAEASGQLASSLDVGTTLSNVAALAVPRLADWCAIDLFDAEGIRRVAVAHADPARAEAAELMRTRFAPRLDDPVGSAEVRRTGESVLVQEITDELLADPRLEPERGELLRSLGLRSALVVPLLSRGRTLGALTLVAAESGRRYDEVDLEFAQHVARRTAAAVDNALLYRQAQEAVRTAEDSFVLLDTLLGTAPVGVAFLDMELRYVRVNDALAEMNGRPAAEHIGLRPSDILTEHGERVTDYLRQVVETGEPLTDVEIEWVARTGTRHRLGSYYPVRRPDGELIGVGAVLVDITERKRSEETFRFLAEASELLAVTLDVEATLDQVARLVVLGVAGQCIVDLLEDDGSTRCVAAAHRDPEKTELLRDLRERYPPSAPGHPVQTALRTGQPLLLKALSDEAVAAMAQSEEHRAQIRVLGNTSGIVVPLVARGRTLGAITLGTVPPQPPYDEGDVGLAEELARRWAVAVDNARLYREAEERAQAAIALSYVGDGVALVDRGGVVRLWNRAAEQITGLPAHELLGRRASEAVPGWAGLVDHVTVESGPSGRAVTLPIDLDGRELWLSVSAVGYPDGAVYAFRDLTEERALERMRADFVSTVSHELRTPLAAIYGAALTLRRDDVVLSAEQHTRLLDVIASESDRLARIVNDILWVSKLDSQTLQVSLERCDVGALVAEVVAAARLHLPPRVTLELDHDPTTPPASCDPDKLRQVLTNLIDNAVKYSPDGGRVEVVVRGGDRVRIGVRDEGLGIPLSEQSRIFEKFYRLDPNLTRGVGGTGLGLYICRELVRMMDGAIWVVSREGRGSTFTVELQT
jgi:PAS domain S-box-containing protein